MKICEIYPAIQGESTHAGLVCTIVRLTGCNLRCSYCDTTYAYEEGYELSEAEVINEINLIGINLVEITGGEPLLQKEVYGLIERLINDGYRVLVETNGSIDIRELDRRAIIILDIKTPGSGMSDKMNFSNLYYLRKEDEVKFVLTDRNDYEWSKAIVEKYKLIDKCHVLFSPAYGILHPQALAKWLIEDKLGVRLNLQLHKYIYGSEQRGV
jgi:7-carboxy-7-deazaguanine synthase